MPLGARPPLRTGRSAGPSRRPPRARTLAYAEDTAVPPPGGTRGSASRPSASASRYRLLALSLLLASAGCTAPDDDDDTAGDDDATAGDDDSAPGDDDSAPDDDDSAPGDDDSAPGDDDSAPDDDDSAPDDDDSAPGDDDSAPDDDDSAFDPTVPLCDPLANVGVITITNDLDAGIVSAWSTNSRINWWTQSESPPIPAGGTLNMPFDGCSAYVAVYLADGSIRFYWFRPSAIAPAITLPLSSLRDVTEGWCSMFLSSDLVDASVLDIELHVGGGPEVEPLMGDDGLPARPSAQARIIQVEVPIPWGHHDMYSDQNSFMDCGSPGAIRVVCPSPDPYLPAFSEGSCP